MPKEIDTTALDNLKKALESLKKPVPIKKAAVPITPPPKAKQPVKRTSPFTAVRLRKKAEIVASAPSSDSKEIEAVPSDGIGIEAAPSAPSDDLDSAPSEGSDDSNAAPSPESEDSNGASSSSGGESGALGRKSTASKSTGGRRITQSTPASGLNNSDSTSDHESSENLAFVPAMMVWKGKAKQKTHSPAPTPAVSLGVLDKGSDNSDRNDRHVQKVVLLMDDADPPQSLDPQSAAPPSSNPLPADFTETAASIIFSASLDGQPSRPYVQGPEAMMEDNRNRKRGTGSRIFPYSPVGFEHIKAPATLDYHMDAIFPPVDVDTAPSIEFEYTSQQIVSMHHSVKSANYNASYSDKLQILTEATRKEWLTHGLLRNGMVEITQDLDEAVKQLRNII